jgi:hypothetical protein
MCKGLDQSWDRGDLSDDEHDAGYALVNRLRDTDAAAEVLVR